MPTMTTRRGQVGELHGHAGWLVGGAVGGYHAGTGGTIESGCWNLRSGHRGAKIERLKLLELVKM